MADLKPFVTERADGRSDRQVIIDLVADCEPMELLTFEQLIDVLQEGLTTRTITREVVVRVVNAANPRLLDIYQRTLYAVRGRGYQVAPPEAHRGIAIDRRRRADNQIRMAMHTLHNVRWHEMSPAAREAHEATLILMAGMWQAIESVKIRQDKMDKLLKKIAGAGPLQGSAGTARHG